MPDGSDDKAVLDRLNMLSYDFDHVPFVRTAKDMHKKRECAFNDSSELEAQIWVWERKLIQIFNIHTVILPCQNDGQISDACVSHCKKAHLLPHQVRRKSVKLWLWLPYSNWSEVLLRTGEVSSPVLWPLHCERELPAWPGQRPQRTFNLRRSGREQGAYCLAYLEAVPWDHLWLLGASRGRDGDLGGTSK